MLSPQPLLTDRYDRALLYARSLHHRQIRKGSQHNPGYYGLPYFSHLLAVSSLVLEHQGSETEAIAALLHDALEDGPSHSDRPIDQIRTDITQNFGPTVLALVEACSQSTDPQRDWYQRKQDYIDSLAHKPFSALLVTTADKLHNARCISRDYSLLGDSLWSRFSQGYDGTCWYYKAIAAALQSVADRLPFPAPTPPSPDLSPTDTALAALDRRPALQSLIHCLHQEIQSWP